MKTVHTWSRRCCSTLPRQVGRQGSRTVRSSLPSRCARAENDTVPYSSTIPIHVSGHAKTLHVYMLYQSTGLDNLLSYTFTASIKHYQCHSMNTNNPPQQDSYILKHATAIATQHFDRQLPSILGSILHCSSIRSTPQNIVEPHTHYQDAEDVLSAPPWYMGSTHSRSPRS